ncbi:actin-like 6B, isoform CRA_b, partial [Rozella allomycis CSF55]
IEIFEIIVRYALEDLLRVEYKDMPVLIVESVLFSKESRHAIAQLMFDKFQVPALYLVKDSVATCFTSGRSSGLVVDVGHYNTKVTPVHDGYVLASTITSQPLAGYALSNQAIHTLENELNLNIVPSFKVKSKRPVGLNEPADYDQVNTMVTNTFHSYHLHKTIEDFKACVLQASESAYNEVFLSQKPNKTYEFPDGFNTSFVTERYRIPESLFQPKQFLLPPPQDGQAILSLPEMILKSVNMCDIDLRANMLSNILITGGTSLLHGVTERLYYELTNYVAANKVKISAPSSSIERRYGSWIGGSILGSLGTFQQLWVSRQEYEELGVSIIDRRCQ